MSTAIMPLPGLKTFGTSDWTIGASDESIALHRKMSMSQAHLDESVSQQPIANLFAELAATWKAETMFSSSITTKTLHPAYQSIIGLGPIAVPLLLAKLQQAPDHWFVALAAITRVNPVPPEDVGNVRRMAERWIRWGVDRRIRF